MSVYRSLLILCLSCLAATAQPGTGSTPPGLPPGIPGLPINNATPPGANNPTTSGTTANDLPEGKLPEINPNIPLADNKIEEDIIEPKLTGNALAVLYRRYTGRRVIVASAAAAAEFSFVQEASPKDPLTFASAAELLRKAAVIENFVFVRHPQDPNLDVLTLAGGLPPNGINLDLYNESSTLPDTDVVITYVMALSHIKPDQAVNVFTQIIGQIGAYGSISPVPNTSSIIITEKASLIRKLIELKKEIDKPSGEISSSFIKVQYADVTEIAETLTTLLTAQQSSQTTAGIQRSPATPAAGTPPGIPGTPNTAANSGGASESNPPQIIPEPRTNRIFIMGRPVDIVFVEGLVREFDIPTTDKTFLRRKLRFLTVSEFLPIAGDALTRAFTGTGEGGTSGGATGGAAKTTGANSSSSRNQSTGRNSSSSRNSSNNSNSSFGAGNSSFGGGSSGGIGGGSSLDDPSISSAPESLLVGRTLLVADNITNTVVAQGPPPALEIIERLLDQIDVKPDQVMISTVIGQLTLDDNFETGTDYLINSGDIVGRGGGGLGPILPILKYLPALPGSDALPDDPTTPEVDPTPAVPGSAAKNTPFEPGTLSPAGGLRGYAQVGDLNIFLKALQSKSDFTVLSRPSVFANNNQKGTISSGERIAIPTGTTSYGGNSNSSTQIQYQDVVLKLEVIPLVNDNKTITMKISLLNDEQNGVQTIPGGAGNGDPLTVPRISTREVITTATVPNNRTIVLGGLIVNKDSQNKAGIPILSDIPYLGRLFSNVEDTKTRSELMVFIQPSIVNNERTMDDVQSSMNNRYKVSSKSRTFSEEPAVLPGVDEIPRIEKKEKITETPKAKIVDPAPASSTKKAVKTIQPFFRR